MNRRYALLLLWAYLSGCLLMSAYMYEVHPELNGTAGRWAVVVLWGPIVNAAVLMTAVAVVQEAVR